MDLVAVAAFVVAGLAVASALLARAETRRADETLSAALANVGARAEEASLAARRERRDRDLALASLEDGVLLLRDDGFPAVVNPSAERLLASRPSSIASLTPASLQEAVRSADAEPHVFQIEAGVPTRVLRVTVQRVGETGSTLVILRDVTDAARLDRMRRDFIENASHELKTPAATIRITAETLRSAALDDPGAVPAFAERIESEAIRLSRMVADLLDLSRLEGGSDLSHPVDLASALSEEVQRIEADAKEAEVTIDVRSSSVRPIFGDARDLALLVRNLLDNAIRYSEGGGTVHASVGMDGDDVLMRVKDDGVGIPSRDLPRIFERFYRVDRGRSRETGGTGLGLAIVKHVAENHGGEVRIRSELGRGTEVEVRFPIGTMSG